MTFAEQIKSVAPHVESLLRIGSVLTPDVMRNIERVAMVDFSQTDEIIKSVTILDNNATNIFDVKRGLSDIRKILDIQNEIATVSDNRDVISIAVGSLDVIKQVVFMEDGIDLIIENHPQYEKVISMHEDIKTAIFMEEDINEISHIAETLRDEILKAEILEEKVQKKLDRTEAILAQAINAEKRVDAKIKYIDEITSRMHNFSIKVEHIDSDKKSSSRYSPTNNELVLKIPAGKIGKTGKVGPRGEGRQGIPGTATNEGKRGVPGRNGTNFAPSAIGGSTDINRYNNHPIGFSFLNLEEIPTMIYFRKSNALGDWTEGQPFGISNGGYSEEERGIDIVNGININELTTHILANMKRREDGSTNSNSEN